ncbi:hypothetical protein TNIN_173691 [Trichonephila inaurata madagascariensis]|uniref:Uncharacterized protein n=1 Tax=Trichonephila inaurata madagascariensis TaxID=2747483 RepID=A0A8X6XQD2_9ARAC|nr:hypothetical protein TNIN_173691 [Trichonephila inaurata madagascariensis]
MGSVFDENHQQAQQLLHSLCRAASQILAMSCQSMENISVTHGSLIPRQLNTGFCREHVPVLCALRPPASRVAAVPEEETATAVFSLSSQKCSGVEKVLLYHLVSKENASSFTSDHSSDDYKGLLLIWTQNRRWALLLAGGGQECGMELEACLRTFPM